MPDPKIFNHLTLPGVKSVTPVAVPKSIFLSFKIWKALALLRSRSWSSIYEKEGLSPLLCSLYLLKREEEKNNNNPRKKREGCMMYGLASLYQIKGVACPCA